MRRKSKRSNGRVGANSSLQSLTSTFPFREVPFRITQASSGTGGLTSVTSGGSSSAANSVPIDPYQVGGRMGAVAQLYTLYRVRYLRITYVPDATASGVTESVSGATTTPSYVSRAFAWGINRDPALSTLSYSQLIQMGGSFGNTTRLQTLTFVNRAPQWYFTSTTASSPSTIDLRMTAPLQLRFAYFNTSTTAAASYGHLIFNIICQFKGILPESAALGLSLIPSTESESKSQDSDDSKTAGLVNQNKTKTWF